MQITGIGEIWEGAIGAWCALAAELGMREASVALFARHGVPERAVPMLCARLSEALLHRGCHDEALECARVAFDLRPESEEIANICAWVFSNCGRHDEAAAAYEQLLEFRPGWVEGHRHASGSFAAAGHLDRATVHAKTASDLDPNSFELAWHAACLFETAGQYEEAVAYLTRAADLKRDESSVVRHLSGAKFAAGQRDQAVTLALRALSLAPGDRANALHATELLLRSKRFDEAAAIIFDLVDCLPQDDIALRLLSETQSLRGLPESGLDAIDRAIVCAPDNAEYQSHRANLLYRLGRLDEAAEAFGNAAALDPSNPDTKRSQLTVYFDSGRFTEAVAVGGELIRIAPENEEYAQAVLRVLQRRFETVDGEYAVVSERALRPWRELRAPPSFFETLKTQSRVILALIIRESRTRFGDSKLGYGWALLEPTLHILMLSLVFAVMMRGRPPIGDQFFIFYYTGIIPYHLFVHTSSSMNYAITSNGSLLQLPLVGTFDVLLARGLLELLTDMVVAIILLAGFGAAGFGALPQNFAGASASLIVVWLLGCGCGYLNAVITAFSKSWDKIWAQLTRLLYFCSGIFYVPGMMPDWIRDVLAWNPILHGVDWFRASFFRSYEPHWLDRSYLLTVAIAALLTGLGLERGLQRRLCEPV